mgnify:CR=1 FL=1
MSAEESANEKKRHGCVTAYLIFLLIFNSGIALLYLTSSNELKSDNSNMPGWVIEMWILESIFNLVCAVALLKWKKWGFWGFTGSSCINFIINLYIGASVTAAFWDSYLMLGILYGVLQIGNDNKGWTQLD